MSDSLGFVIITHHKVHQLKRLIHTLNEMFDYPPIVCHHNFSITPLDIRDFSKNIQFVYPHVKTKWGKFSTIEAEIEALKILYKDRNRPDWFVILSGSDYPIKPAKEIIHDLSQLSCDALIHHEAVTFNNLKSDWQKLGYQRYCTVKAWIPVFDHNRKPRKKFISLIRNPKLANLFTPFSTVFTCYVGDHFFCANSHIAHYLINTYRSNPRLENYYRRCTIFPTESYYQTILANSGKFKLLNNNYRYIDWSVEGAHPKTLTINDLPAIEMSAAHFARKFDIDEDSSILDYLDRIIR